MFFIYADGKSIYEPLDNELIVYSQHLTLEMGKAGSLQFVVPPSHRYYSQFYQLKTIVTVELDGVEIFRGRVLTNNRDFNNLRTIYCEGDLAYLVDSVQRATRFEGTTHELFRQIIARHNERMDPHKRFAVGMIGIENRSIILSGQSDETGDLESSKFNYQQIVLNSIADNWETTLDYLESSLIETCGGYLRTRHADDTTYIDLVKEYGGSAVQEIEFGVNMLDLTQEVSAEDVFTVLIPLGEENLTIASLNHGSDELVDAEGVRLYGRIVKTKVFDSVSKPETLLENALRYMSSHENLPVTVTVKAIDMHLLDQTVQEIHVGDKVHVRSFPHNLVDTLTCTKIEYDLGNPANNTYTFGTPKQTMTERYRKDIRKANEYSVKNAGRSGGKAGEEAENNTQDQLDKFYDAWINEDKELGHIDLGTLYREFYNGKKTLESSCGISLDAPSGNINIKALRNDFDDVEKAIDEQSAYIDMLNDEQTSRIELVAARTKKIEDATVENHAEMVNRTNDLQAQIDLHTYHFSNTDKEVKEAATNIDMLSKDLLAQIELEASHHDQLNGKITNTNATVSQLATNLKAQVELEAKHKKETDESIASILLTADSHGSQIALKADKVTLNAKVTEINGKLSVMELEIGTLKADVAKVDKLVSDKIDAALMQSRTIFASKISAQYIDVPYGNSIKINGYTVATNEWVKLQKYVTESALNAKGYLTELPATIRVDTLSATKNMYYKGYTVATEQWVKNYVSGLLSKYAKTGHTHKFSASASIPNGHTHTVTVGGVRYSTGGVSTNVTHSISISGTTGANS